MSLVRWIGSQLGLFEPAPQPAAPAPPAQGARVFDDGEHRFEFVLRRAPRKSVGIRITDQGVVVGAPRWVTLAQIHDVLADKAPWVQRQLLLRAQRLQRLDAARIDWGAGGRLPYLGRTLQLELHDGRAARHVVDRDSLLLPRRHAGSPAALRACAKSWMQNEARALFAARAQHFAAQLGVQVRAIALSSAATRWGSASASGNLRLHWGLLHFTPEIVDYVVAHEVAHLREMNHSARFWAQVELICPHWRESRAALRECVLPPW